MRIAEAIKKINPGPGVLGVPTPKIYAWKQTYIPMRTHIRLLYFFIYFRFTWGRLYEPEIN